MLTINRVEQENCCSHPAEWLFLSVYSLITKYSDQCQHSDHVRQLRSCRKGKKILYMTLVICLYTALTKLLSVSQNPLAMFDRFSLS